MWIWGGRRHAERHPLTCSRFYAIHNHRPSNAKQLIAFEESLSPATEIHIMAGPEMMVAKSDGPIPIKSNEMLEIVTRWILKIIDLAVRARPGIRVSLRFNYVELYQTVSRIPFSLFSCLFIWFCVAFASRSRNQMAHHGIRCILKKIWWAFEEQWGKVEIRSASKWRTRIEYNAVR